MAVNFKTKEVKRDPAKAKVMVRNLMNTIFCAAITYEGAGAKFAKDNRYHTTTLTDSLYDLNVRNLIVCVEGMNELGTSFADEQDAYLQLVEEEYPEFADQSWRYTGSFIHGSDK